jgi:hypothetical protein
VSFFNLLQKVAVFVKSSYKRTNVWLAVVEKHYGTARLKQLKLIGETRWSGKSNAAKAIFGTYKNPNAATLVDLIVSLFTISHSDKFDPKIKEEALVYLNSLLKFETILMALIFLRIFENITPANDYLQTSGLSMIKAWQMITSTIQQLSSFRSQFDEVHRHTLEFVNVVNSLLDEVDDKIFDEMGVDKKLFSEITMEEKLQMKRSRKKKKMYGETTEDERNTSDALSDMKIHSFYPIMDRIIEAFNSRFEKHRALYADISFLDPRNFNDIINSNNDLPTNSLQSICKIIPEINIHDVKNELISFINNFKFLKKSSLQEYIDIEHNADNDEEIDIPDNAKYFQCTQQFKCECCSLCVLKLLDNLRLHDLTYDNLYVIYKILLTLSVTQVSCERSFSKLKLIKTRLRSNITSENLEAFLVMSVEKELLQRITSDEVINELIKYSNEWIRYLT